MALQWTGELRNIYERAERDASLMQVRMSSALLFRSMLRSDMPIQTALHNAGISYPIFEDGLKHIPLTPDPPDAINKIFTRATALCAKSRSEKLSSFHVLSAMLREPCIVQWLLCALGCDINQILNYIEHCIAGDQNLQYFQTQSRSSHSISMVAVQHRSPIAQPTTYIEPQPAVSYGSDEISRIASPEGRKGIAPPPRNRLLSPSEIKNLSTGASQPTLPGIPQSSHAGSQETRTAKPASYHSTSSREMQQAATIDLARRFQEKKSRTSEARKASRELPKTPAENAPKLADAQVCETSDSSTPKPAAQTASPAPSAQTAANQTDSSAAIRDQAKATSDAKASSETPPTMPEKTAATVSTTTGMQSTPNTVQARKTEPAPAEKQPRTRQSVSAPAAPTRAAAVPSRRQSSKLPSGFSPFDLGKNYPMLNTFGRNLLAEARAGRIDPVIDRDQEIDQLIDVLNKRKCNNPILVGEAGVGKTAIIEGLALRMAQSNAPRGLENHTIVTLDYGSILCGTQLRGAVQERIKAIKTEISKANGLIILFLDEIHTWLTSGSGDPNSDAALELKMALSRGELLCIGASTPQELRRAFNADPAFERRFDFIEVKALSPETSIRIIENGIIRKYAEHHGVTYAKDAIREAVRLSVRYIQERALPDKAISVLDRAGSLCERAGDPEVTPKHIAQVIAKIADVPVERLLVTEKQKLMDMEKILGERLIGHEANIAKIASVIRRNHAGFGAQRPIGSFLFLGPTGVGKTEAAKVLADFLFGSPKNIIRFDMSEFMEQHSVAKLIGAPAGYVGFDDGGLLTEALRKRPYQIVLFDEIEKAHPDVMNILLQILDEGRLTDAKGRHVDFSNTVVILTSNLGAEEVIRAAQNIGFNGNAPKPSAEEAEAIILKAANARFSPELWNRIEEKLVFHPLTIEQIEKIAHLLLNDSKKRLLEDKQIELIFDETLLIPYLIEHGGFDPKYGARPMRKTIQALVESRVADWILSHDYKPEKLYVFMKEGMICVDENLLMIFSSQDLKVLNNSTIAEEI